MAPPAMNGLWLAPQEDGHYWQAQIPIFGFFHPDPSEPYGIQTGCKMQGPLKASALTARDEPGTAWSADSSPCGQEAPKLGGLDKPPPAPTAYTATGRGPTWSQDK